MSVASVSDVEFGEDLPVFEPDTSLDNVIRFTEAAGWRGPRFTDHEAARKEGLPGALVPGIMSQGFLAAMIHRWAPGPPDRLAARAGTAATPPAVAASVCRSRPG